MAIEWNVYRKEETGNEPDAPIETERLLLRPFRKVMRKPSWGQKLPEAEYREQCRLETSWILREESQRNPSFRIYIPTRDMGYHPKEDRTLDRFSRYHPRFQA